MGELHTKTDLTGKAFRVQSAAHVATLVHLPSLQLRIDSLVCVDHNRRQILDSLQLKAGIRTVPATAIVDIPCRLERSC